LRAALANAGPVSQGLHALLPHLRSGCLLILGFEGDPGLAAAEERAARRVLEDAGARDLGEEPGRRWYERRYRVSYQQSKVFEDGAFVDTLEVAATWDRLPDLYEEVRGALMQHAIVLGHFSHAYPEGCSIYFTFVAAAGDRALAERRYDALVRGGALAAQEVGGVLSHHHGIGLAKQRFMAAEHGAGMDLLHACKRVLDPAGILNPGKMGLST
jgi:alkyldihydroxyacetonephosphate synthase